MKTSIRIALGLFLFVGFAAHNEAQEKVSSEFTVLVAPKESVDETELHIGSAIQFAGSAKATDEEKKREEQEKKGNLFWKKISGDGEKRVFKLSLEKGKEYKFRIQTLVQPNNYERITRFKEITIKGGDNVEVDLSKKLPTDLTWARWVPTPDDIVDKMSAMAKVTKDDVVYDLGCGDAVMLIRPIQKFNAKRGVGIDIDPEIVVKARENVKKANLEKKVEIRQGDILNVKDMSEATVVLLYIGDVLGERLSPVLKKTLKPGARIVSHRFLLGDWRPTRTETVTGADGYEYTLHVWVVAEAKKK